MAATHSCWLDSAHLWLDLTYGPPVCNLCPLVQLISIYGAPAVCQAQIRHSLGNCGGRVISQQRPRGTAGDAQSRLLGIPLLHVPQGGEWPRAGDRAGVSSVTQPVCMYRSPASPGIEGLHGWPSRLQAFPKIYRGKLSLPVAQNCSTSQPFANYCALEQKC